MTGSQLGQADLFLHRAAALHQQGRLEEACFHYHQALELNPHLVPALHLSGMLAIQSNLPQHAMELFARALALQPQNPEFHLGFGYAACQLKMYEVSIASYDKAIVLKPGFAEAHYHRGDTFREINQHETAVASYNSAIAISPTVDACNNRGISLLELKQYQAANASFDAAIALDPACAAAYYNCGNSLRHLEEYEAALASYDRAIVCKPDYVDAHVNRGSTLLFLKRYDTALASFNSALALSAAYSEAFDGRGNALHGLLQYEAAVASFDQAIALNPDYAGAYFNRGNALLELGHRKAAEASYHQALILRPEYSEAYCNLGRVLGELGDLDEAADSYQAALVLQPESTAALTGLANVQRLQSRATQAEINLRLALQLNPMAPEIIIGVGDLTADKGQFAEAETLYRKALALDPDSVAGWAGIAALRRMSGSDTEWIAETRRLALTLKCPRDEAVLLFAIGKYFDDIQEYAQAFPIYLRANEAVQRCRQAHDRDQVSRNLESTMRLYDREFLDQARVQTATSPRPVFIVGMPRSGTSLAEQILASHPEVFGAGELSFWKTTAPKIGAATLANGASKTLSAQTANRYLQLLAELAQNPSRVVDKMPGNFAYLGMIHAAFPHARIVHMRRNPIDTCLSIYFQNLHISHTYANDLDDLAHYYDAYLRLMQHWRAILPHDAVLDVAYEDLVGDPETWSRKMVEFVNLSWSPACLEFHATSRSVSTLSRWQVRQKISKTSIGRWRNYAPYVWPLRRLSPDAASD